MSKLERQNYFISSDEVWSAAPGTIGIEIGDAQSNASDPTIPIYISCSVKESWIKIPGTDYELNLEAESINICITMNGVSMVHGSQVGKDTNPYTREIFVEAYEESRAEKSWGLKGALTGVMSAAKPNATLNAEVSAGGKRSGIKKHSDNQKRSEKIVQTRINYFPPSTWVVSCRFPESEGNMFFNGSIYSDIICRVEGLDKYANVKAELEIPPEYINSNKIRDVKTAKEVERQFVPNPGKRLYDKDHMTDNLKLAVIEALL